MEIPQESRDEFSRLLREARETLGKNQQQASRESGVSPATIGLLERSGPYVSLRAIDLLRLVRYYGLDIGQVASLLGVTVTAPVEEASLFPPTMTKAISALSEEDRAYVVGVVNVLLRGMRRR